MSEQNTLEYWEQELSRIVSMHHNPLSIDINFSYEHGVPFYKLRMLHYKENIFYSGGRHLWKRYKYAVQYLKAYYGENTYKYENYGSIKPGKAS